MGGFMKQTIEHTIIGGVIGGKVERHTLAKPPRPEPLDGGSLGMDVLPAEPVDGQVAQSDWEEAIDQRIAEADAAANELARLEALRAKAEQATQLRQAKARLQRAEQMEPLADREQAAITAELLDVAKQTQEWRKEWIEVYDKLEDLAQRLPALTNQIMTLNHRTQRLAATRIEIRNARGELPPPADALLGDPTAANLWERVGGLNPELMPLRSETGIGAKWEKLLMLIRNSPVQSYTSRMGRMLGRMR